MFDTLHSAKAIQLALNKIQTHLHNNERTIIALAGGPGSGKSTLANYLVKQTRFSNTDTEIPAVISLPMDGFHFTKQALKSFPDPAKALTRRGADWTFDSQAFAQQVEKLATSYQQEDCYWPSFDHSLGDPIENSLMIHRQTKVVIIEGLYLLLDSHHWLQARRYYQQTWFLDVPLDTAMARLSQRHQQAWGISAQQANERIQQNDALNAKTVADSRSRADWLIQV
ncbi:hypothetical protein [Marinomonas sp. THO17]|uniref:hypothetical protein n=1 Tax=Marinomonas sp. THO17 TaxID=3149048 RepID=UPI00336BE459